HAVPRLGDLAEDGADDHRARRVARKAREFWYAGGGAPACDRQERCAEGLALRPFALPFSGPLSLPEPVVLLLFKPPPRPRIHPPLPRQPPGPLPPAALVGRPDRLLGHRRRPLPEPLHRHRDPPCPPHRHPPELDRRGRLVRR